MSSYIIVWRNNHKEPFLDTNTNAFLETYSTYDEAKAAAEEIERAENSGEESPWYFNFQIYEEASS